MTEKAKCLKWAKMRLWWHKNIVVNSTKIPSEDYIKGGLLLQTCNLTLSQKNLQVKLSAEDMPTMTAKQFPYLEQIHLWPTVFSPSGPGPRTSVPQSAPESLKSSVDALEIAGLPVLKTSKWSFNIQSHCYPCALNLTTLMSKEMGWLVGWVPGSWLQGCGFGSQLERQENFLPQS